MAANTRTVQFLIGTLDTMETNIETRLRVMVEDMEFLIVELNLVAVEVVNNYQNSALVEESSTCQKSCLEKQSPH